MPSSPHLPRATRQALLLATLLATPSAHAAQCAPQELVPEASFTGEQLGTVVALAPERAAAANDTLSAEGRRVVVFERGANGWAQEAELRSSLETFSFGDALSLHGSSIAVGAPQDVGPADGGHEGSVTIFDRSPFGWVETARVVVPGNPGSLTLSQAGFGADLELGQHELAVGAPLALSSSQVLSGRVYLFDRSLSGWGVTQVLEPAPLEPLGRFGSRVAMDGDVLAVSAPTHTAGGDMQGAVFVFERTLDDWQQVAVLRSDEPMVGGDFASSLDLEGETLVVGARLVTHAGQSSAGAAWIFERQEDGVWVRAARLEPPPSAQVFNAQFGRAVAVSGDVVAVGSLAANGFVHVYQRVAGEWHFVHELAGDAFELLGSSIDLVGRELLAGLPLASDAGLGSGGAQLFEKLIPATDLGGSLAGGSGAPRLVLTGDACANSPFELRLDRAASDAAATLVVGLSEVGLPLKGGVLLPAADKLLFLTTSAAGELQLAGSWPATTPNGLSVYLQTWVRDAGAPLGFAASNALRVELP